MIVNKLDKQMQASMKNRTRVGLLMLLYGLGVLFCLSLSDKTSDGWSSYLTIDQHIHDIISFVFAVISVLGMAWIIFFIGKEIHNCFIGNGNKRQINFIRISMWLIQLVPTFIWIYPNYFHNYLNVGTSWTWFFAFISSGVIISLLCYPFLFMMVRKGARSTTFNKIMFPLCVIGVSWAFGCIYYLSIVRYWTTIVILLVVVVGCDITAYFAGVLFGKHKMAPNISPKKSWEGAIIGSLVSAGLLVLFIYLFSLIPHNFDNDVRKSSMDVAYNFFGVQFENYFDNTVDKWQWWVTVSAIAITLTVVSICGDLLFSWFKRQNKIKDFGNTLQGHGGFLDRIDSLTTVILVFTVITFVISAFTVCYHGVSDGIWSVSHFFPEWH